MKKLLGQLLLWAGFLSGALATVWRQNVVSEDATEVWNTIPWTWYIISAVICAVGAIILQFARRTGGGSTENTVANLQEIKKSLALLNNNIKSLDTRVASLAPSKITQEIDDVLAEDFRIFADGRDSITAEYGLQRFADVMSYFASGERAINRAWSAAADGYVDEAATCIDRAATSLQEASTELDRAEQERT